MVNCSFPSGSENALKTMLEHKLDVHDKDKTGGTALHSAAYSGHVSCVKLLIQFGACVDALDLLQHTPIYRACEMGHTDVVHNLILSKSVYEGQIQDPRSLRSCLAVNSQAPLKNLARFYLAVNSKAPSKNLASFYC